MPANPRAWLISTGRFKAIDAMRRRARFDASQVEIAERLEAEDRAQALIAGAGPGSGDAVKGRARSTSSRDPRRRPGLRESRPGPRRVSLSVSRCAPHWIGMYPPRHGLPCRLGRARAGGR